MIFNGNYVFSTISCQFSMLSNCNFTFFFIFCEFSMLSNGKFASCHFPMLFNGNLRIEKLWGRGGHIYVRTDGCKEIHPCVLQNIDPLGPLPKKEKIPHVCESISH